MARGWGGVVTAVALLALSGCGCGRGEAAKPPRPKPPAVNIDRENPERTVYEQLRAGAFQIAGVEATIEEVLVKVNALKPGTTAEGLQDLVDALDSVGATLADHTTEPTEPAKTAAGFAAMDERRLAAISASNDALHELEDAGGILEALRPSLGDRPEVPEIAELLQLGVEDLREAIRSLGGVVEQPS
jgi:hypothetical protein